MAVTVLFQSLKFDFVLNCPIYIVVPGYKSAGVQGGHQKQG